MRRKQFLQLTGLNSDDLKNLVRRQTIPIANNIGEDEDPDTMVGWREYSARDVISTVLMLKLSSLGMSQSAATNFIVSHGDVLHGRSILYEGDVWFGAAEMVWAGPNGSAVVMQKPVFGQSDRLKLKSGGDEYDFEEVASSARNLLLINISALHREVYQRAKSNGLEGHYTELFPGL